MSPKPLAQIVECRVSSDRVFVSYDDTTARTIELNDVQRVIAWKRDRWSFDEIVVTLELNGNDAVEISEDATGYNELVARLESTLPGFPMTDQWWKDVGFPPFAENPTVLWEKRSHSGATDRP